MAKRRVSAKTVNNPDPEGDTFGGDVRRVRNARGMSQDGLALATGYSRTYVSKVEKGTLIPAPRFAEGCDKAFDTGDLFARQLRRVTGSEYPSWFAPFIDAERDASKIQDYSTLFVYGLLQTPEYARATLRAGRAPSDDDNLEAMVTSRVRRREILAQETPPEVWVVLHEACLRARIGSSQVMAEQLTHVLDEVRRSPTLTVQVLPYEAAEAGLGTPFTVLDIDDSGPVVHAEGPQGGRPYNAQGVIASANDFYDRLRASSLSPHDSAIFISDVRNDHARDAVGQVELQRPAGRQLRRVGPGTRVRRKRPRPGQ